MKGSLIGEAITGYSSHKKSIDWYSLSGYKQVTQVHSYDIFVINTCPCFALDSCNNKDIIRNWVITTYNIRMHIYTYIHIHTYTYICR